MRSVYGVAVASLALMMAGIAIPVRGQLPLAGVRASGQTVTPAYEGWYRNPDGSHSLSFGYLNRNAEEVVEIPIGPNNFIDARAAESGSADASFSRAGIGACSRVKVPADFGNEGGRLDAEVPRRDLRDSRIAAPELADRRARRRGRRGQHAAGAEVRRDGPEGRGPGRHHRRAAHGDRRRTADAHGLGERRRQGRGVGAAAGAAARRTSRSRGSSIRDRAT